jgi:class I fructose-bisphosphate aldolase
MIKIKYSGSEQTFRKAVQSAGKTKVVLSGGPKVEDDEILKIIGSVMKAGATGIAVGRNVFQHQDPLAMTEKIKEIVFD